MKEQENNRTLNINAGCDEIIQLAQCYKFNNVKILNEQSKTLYIKSCCSDEWYAEPRNSSIVLLHQNKNNKHKHLQREYRDWNFLLKSIKEHDIFKYGIVS